MSKLGEPGCILFCSRSQKDQNNQTINYNVIEGGRDIIYETVLDEIFVLLYN